MATLLKARLVLEVGQGVAPLRLSSNLSEILQTSLCHNLPRILQSSESGLETIPLGPQRKYQDWSCGDGSFRGRLWK